jgi:hypothetical protein
MLCSDTGSHEAIRYEHLDKRTLTNLNKLIGEIKSAVFGGNGFIGLFYTGGNVPKFEFKATVLNEEEPQLKRPGKKTA